MKLHNLEAYVLLDSGCMSDSMSPEFATSMNLKVYELEELVPLQLGTVGSHSKINFRLFTDFGIGQVNGNHYFDVVNIDRYNAILGTMFMRKHGIVLDFEHDNICLKGKILETIIEGESTFRQVHRVKGPLTKKDIPRLRDEWKTSCQDILSRVPDTLPPLREINHHIPLVDEQKRYNYHLPKCPDSMRKPLAEKISKYCKAGWWCPA
ncbi:hypothetical protein L208DRAFT_1280352 [Tricholoma matsutake]|nr:hypothetical protein L208DRAFT_1280352 [Tricholoma matsutake 945]